ncbi:efflux RND transporter periplasmic adaptor subunit [Pleurocapsa sp. CCALA 161]|uniref:efflux RND transporter periplasmic adaptor subunit n=1 Tax=Pleurocapsa sp. CCALA 161 TaxID=2107688 RepID=UPI000D04F7FC|nr:efflux RND transporter periplasmic adaptor subunit [Pleurocapsa sp. CCALA 161]PSB09015.1 efflux RND transporter periplasmic adaptor subunit [Pleurocapsa sp. CCALA 161]
MNKISDSSIEESELKEPDSSLLDKKSDQTDLAKPTKKRSHWIIIILIALIISGAGIYFLSRRKNTQPNLQSRTVPVQTQSLQVSFEASGTVEPITSVNISPKTTGRLTALYVEQGDKVKAGQLLARMDSANLTAELAQAQAEYTKVLNGNRLEAIARGKSQVLSAKAQADLSAKRLEKNRWLAQEGAIAQLTLDEYISTDKTARASLVEAQEQLRELENGSRLEDIEQSKAKVAAAKAKVDLVRTDLNETAIYAPFNGIISQKYATVGAVVTPNVSASTTSSATSSSILSIASGLEVNVNVSEVNIAQIEPNQKVKITADAYPYRAFQGRVKHIAPEAIIENNVTSFEVKVELITGKTELRSGMNVDAVFVGKKIANALTIPTVAITTNQGEIGVMVLGDRNQAQFKPVRVGFSEGGQTQIIQGLKASDKPDGMASLRVFIDFPPGQTPLRTGLP